MAKFIEQYVRRPVGEVSAYEKAFDGEPARRKIELLDLVAKLEGDSLKIQIGNHMRQVSRSEDPTLGSDDKDDE